MNLVEHVQSCLEKTLKSETRLPPEILSLDGYSGKMGRSFLNHVCNLEKVQYLEIGCCKGSTLLSASYDNPGIQTPENLPYNKFQAIDDFSQFGGNLAYLNSLKDRFSPHCNFDIFVSDCWQIDKSLLAGNYNIYFYDGPHGLDDHEKAITHYYDLLAKTSIVIIDDWNGDCARNGTRAGIEKAGVKVLFEKEIGHTTDSDRDGWWNGFGIFVVEK